MILKLDLYECRIHLHVVEKNEDVDKKAKSIFKKHKQKYINEDNFSCGLCIPLFTDYYVVVSRESSSIINTLLHEISHVVDFITKDRQIEDDESRAYLMGYIGEKFLNKIK